MTSNQSNHKKQPKGVGSPKWYKLLKQFIHQPKQLGALIPSGKALVNQMVHCIPENFEGNVLEIGLGSGVITEAIRKKIASPEQYVGVELDTEIFENLQKRHPDLKFVNQSAEHLVEIIGDGKKIDRIICSLPWTFFPEELQLKILHAIGKVMASDGVANTYLYLQSPMLQGGRGFLKNLNAVFPSNQKSHLILENLPPAYVYEFKRNEVKE